ncbi:MAG TPA: hypothetical protein VGS05_03535 [Candidatus Sulfotelmatobacter sp.]|nr:hypothetical protein [Candidatus Sulfotelmatobacter sp.]
MATTAKCPKCGQEVTITAASACPMCGAKMVRPLAPKIWVAGLVQVAISTIFMLLCGFPKVMILPFVTLILIGTALSARFKIKPAVVRQPIPQRPVAHPIVFGIVNLLTVLSAFGLVAFLLLGSVIFLNSWNTWHQYEGQPHHESDFVVKRAYYQAHRKGSASIYASGTVEGNQEWMSLRPYVDPLPRNQDELDSQVSAGTSIHIYFYPHLKGWDRIVVYEQGPPDEDARRTAMNTLKYAPLGALLAAGLIFLLARVRRLCFAEEPMAMAAANSSS